VDVSVSKDQYTGLYGLAAHIETELMRGHNNHSRMGLRLFWIKLGTGKKGLELYSLMQKVISRRFALTSDVEKDQELSVSFQAVLAYYITPHVFPFGPGNVAKQNELSLNLVQKSTIWSIVDVLWQDEEFRGLAYQKLELLIDEHQSQNQPPLNVYGKCAETYPVVGVGYVWPLICSYTGKPSCFAYQLL
jgi:hypothetical protein